MAMRAAVQSQRGGVVPCASQILDRGAEAAARGAARCALLALDRDAQAVSRGATRCTENIFLRTSCEFAR